MEKESDQIAAPSAQGDTWWSKQKKEAASFSAEDCAGCRYVAGLGMYGAAVYVAHTGMKRQKMRGASLWGAAPALITSALLAGMGTARLLRMNPFSSKGNETGIDLVQKALEEITRTAGAEKPRADDTGS